jgi:hypothetical protein
MATSEMNREASSDALSASILIVPLCIPPTTWDFAPTFLIISAYFFGALTPMPNATVTKDHVLHVVKWFNLGYHVIFIGHDRQFDRPILAKIFVVFIDGVRQADNGRYLRRGHSEANWPHADKGWDFSLHRLLPSLFCVALSQ